MTSACENITSSFTSSVDASLQEFTEQNNLLSERVEELSALREEIKSTTKEIQTIKSFFDISKDLKEFKRGKIMPLHQSVKMLMTFPQILRNMLIALLRS